MARVKQHTFRPKDLTLAQRSKQSGWAAFRLVVCHPSAAGAQDYRGHTMQRARSDQAFARALIRAVESWFLEPEANSKELELCGTMLLAQSQVRAHLSLWA